MWASSLPFVILLLPKILISSSSMPEFDYQEFFDLIGGHSMANAVFSSICSHSILIFIDL